MSLASPSWVDPDAWPRSGGHQPCVCGYCRAAQIPALARHATISVEVPEECRRLRQETACPYSRVQNVPSFALLLLSRLLFRGQTARSPEAQVESRRNSI